MAAAVVDAVVVAAVVVAAALLATRLTRARACALGCVAWASTGVAGCRDGQAHAVDDRVATVVQSRDAASGPVYTLDERWRFEGGVVLDNVQVTPNPVVAGEPVSVRFDVQGVRGEIELTLALQPPRAASRQVALGGVDAPPPTVPVDPRTVAVQASLSADTQTVSQTLRLPVPWHPRQSVLTVALHAGAQPIRALAGPRTEAGVAMIGLLPVQPSPTQLLAQRAATPPEIDGVLDEALWSQGQTGFVQSQDGEPWDGTAGFVVLAWDESFLYAAADIPDRDIAATMTAHDDPLWKEEVFELFVFGQAPASRYLELQVSPRGVTFDAKFGAYRKGDTTWDSGWKTAVDLRGTVDERGDTDEGWSVEVAVPWTEICAHTAAPCPPKPGTRLVINAFRFERPAKGSTVGLALSPTRVPDFHAADNAAWLELGS